MKSLAFTQRVYILDILVLRRSLFFEATSAEIHIPPFPMSKPHGTDKMKQRPLAATEAWQSRVQFPCRSWAPTPPSYVLQFALLWVK